MAARFCSFQSRATDWALVSGAARKVDQKIMIQVPDGRGIRQVTVTLVGFEKGMAKLGFEAPTDVRIYREEVLESIRKHGPHLGSNME